MLLVTAEEMRALDRLTIERYGTPGHVLMERAGARRDAACCWSTSRTLRRSGRRVVDRRRQGQQRRRRLRHRAPAAPRGVRTEVVLLGAGRGESTATPRAPARVSSRCAGAAARGRPRRARLGELAHALAARPTSSSTRSSAPGSTSAGARAARRGDRADQCQRRADVRGRHSLRPQRRHRSAAWAPPSRPRRPRPSASPRSASPAIRACELLRALAVVDIGIAPEAIAAHGRRAAALLEAADGRRAWCRARQPDAHKGDCGHVLVIAGSFGKTGAAQLATRAAGRTGAGLVTRRARRPRCIPIYAAGVLEAMTEALPDEDGRIRFDSGAPARACRRQDGDRRRSRHRHARGRAPHRALAARPAPACRSSSMPTRSTVLARDPAVLRRAARAADPHAASGRDGAPDSGATPRRCRPIASAWRAGSPADTAARWSSRGRAPSSPTPTSACGSIRPATRAWPRAAWATSSPASSAGCWRKGLTAAEAACLGVYLHGAVADRAAADGEIGLLASDVIAALRATMHALKGDRPCLRTGQSCCITHSEDADPRPRRSACRTLCTAASASAWRASSGPARPAWCAASPRGSGFLPARSQPVVHDPGRSTRAAGCRSTTSISSACAPALSTRVALREYLYGRGVCAIEWFEHLDEPLRGLPRDLARRSWDRTAAVGGHRPRRRL